MVHPAHSWPDDPMIVVTNPDEDTSPAAQHAFLTELFSGPEPEIESVGGAELIRQLRDDA